MSIFWSFLFFCILAYLNFYLPGRLLLHLGKQTFTPYIQTLSSFTVGIAFFLLSNYLFAYMHAPGIWYAVIIAIVCYLFMKQRELFRMPHLSIDTLSVSIILLGTIACTLMTFFSGWHIAQGLQFFGVNGEDGIMHVGFIQSQVHTFPPIHISLSGYQMLGYHYFYDFFVSRLVFLYHLNVYDMHFRVLPFFLSLLLGSWMYAFASLFTTSTSAKNFILFFTYFGQSSAWIYYFFVRSTKPSFSPANGFDIQQPLALITDPSIFLSLIIFFCGFYIVLAEKRTLQTSLLGALCIGILAQIKVYTGMIGMGGLVMLCVTTFFFARKESRFFIQTFLFSFMITLATYAPNNWGQGGLVWAPLLIYSELVSSELFSWMHWDTLRRLYVEHHNVPRLIQLYTEAILIFWIGNLGVRLLALGKINILFSKHVYTKLPNILLISALLICLSIPSFWIQSFSVFNIMQLLWIGTVLLALPVGIVFGEWYTKWHTFGRWVLVLGTIISSVLGVFATIRDPFAYPMTVTHQEITLLQGASKDKETTIIVLPAFHRDIYGIQHYDWNPAPLIATLTQQSTYVEDEDLLFSPKLEVVAEQRRQRVYALMQAFATCDKQQIIKQTKQIGSKTVVSYAPFTCTNLGDILTRSQITEGLSVYNFK